MPNFLPDLYEGHAPITLQQLFGDALDAFDTWEDERPEPYVIYQDQLVPIGRVFERMGACTDLVPRAMVDIISDILPKPSPASLQMLTFATASAIMTELVHQRRLYGEAAMSAFQNHSRTDRRRPA